MGFLAKIIRSYDIRQTTGNLLVYEDANLLYRCLTLERPYLNNQRGVSCIPEGSYIVTKRKPSNRTPYLHFWIHNIPDRSGILIHAGNFVYQIRGCIIVGSALKDINNDWLVDVVDSKKTLAKLLNILPDKFDLIIEKKSESLINS